MTQPSENGPERRPANVPTVLMFQPTQFEIVPPEKVSEWEATLQERVGLQPVQEMRPGIRCYSFCGDVIFDDCDEL